MIIDAHVHVIGGGLGGVDRLDEVQGSYGYGASNLLSLECMDDAAQNALGIYYKLKYPGNYAFGGFTYRLEYDFKDEAERLSRIGFDGIKMVENKPNLRKKLKMASNDGRYDGFYGWAESTGFPLIVHIADPEEFWNGELIPQWALEAGFFYGDGSFVEKEDIYAEMFDVLARFEGLNVCMAHFLFMSGDMGRLDALMKRFKNLKLDIVAGTEMYYNFTKDANAWRDFFIRYQDRILFGTDNVNVYDENDIGISRVINRFENEFLTRTGGIPAWDDKFKGIGLPDDVLDKVYHKNFIAFASERPKAIDKEAAGGYLRERLKDKRYKLTDEERSIISAVLQYISDINCQ